MDWLLVKIKIVCYFRTTCTNIIAKLIRDEDKYQFGKTKLFFRAGLIVT